MRMRTFDPKNVGGAGVSVRSWRLVFPAPGGLGMALHYCSGEEREGVGNISLQVASGTSDELTLHNTYNYTSML